MRTLSKNDIPQPQEFMFKCENPKLDIKNRQWRRCGKCEYCKKIKTREWQIRCMHELMMRKKAVFFTLTYKNNPINLKPEDCTKFIKRLRKYYDKYKIKLKYIYCGEYGPRTLRPHYHFIIFGLDNSMITKKLLKKIWGLGHVDLDENEISEKVIAYILGYVRKKQGQDYSQFKQKPFKRQSQGIGKEYALKKKEQWTNSYFFNLNGYKVPVPRYYQQLVYKEEGKIIKRITPILKPDGKIEKQYYYQVIKNVNGKYTKIILERQREQLNERIKRAEETFKRIENFNLEKWKKELYFNQKLMFYNNKKLDKLFKQSTTIILPEKIWHEKKKLEETNFVRYPELMRTSAKQYNHLIITSPHGYRDKIDLQI